jgi:hypothetical protein
MFSRLSGRLLGALATAALAVLASITLGCGGTTPAPASGSSSGNWQFTLVQGYPTPASSFGVSGFMVEAHDGSVTGNLEVPPLGKSGNCAGVASAVGTINGQSVTLAIDVFGTEINLTGTVSTDGTTMSGDYQGPQGACFTQPTTGTWSAFLVPPLNGSFTGTINSKTYMEAITGSQTPVPVAVTGTLTQSDNAGGSNATISGTINATNYPCFATANVTGTISGQNVYLTLYGYNGQQIGTLGQPGGGPGSPNQPATVVVGSNGLSLVDDSSNGLYLLTALVNLIQYGPCPPYQLPGTNSPNDLITYDNGTVSLTFQ